MWIAPYAGKVLDEAIRTVLLSVNWMPVIYDSRGRPFLHELCWSKRSKQVNPDISHLGYRVGAPGLQAQGPGRCRPGALTRRSVEFSSGV